MIEICENGKDIYMPYSIKKGKKDFITNTLMLLAAIDLVCLMLVMIIGSYLEIKQALYQLTSDFIAAIGLLAMFYSFSKPREYIGKNFFYYGKKGNKLYIFIVIFVIAFAIAFVLYKLGLSNSFSNLISAFCVLVALKNLQ